MKLIYKQDGYTLVELILYIATISILLTTVSVFFVFTANSRQKARIINEVDHQGTYAMEYITRSIRNADVINSPASGSSATTLSLGTDYPSTSPTIFSLSSGSLQVEEGGGAASPLTDSKVTISGLLFENLTKPDTDGSIQVTFTVSYKSDNNLSQTSYQKTFITTASLKQ